MTTLSSFSEINKSKMNIKPITSKTELSNSSETTDRNELSNLITLLGLLPWHEAVIVSIFTLLVLITVIGNTLVILSVMTTRRLRTVTNCYVMNLAVTDWLVGTCVMPPSIFQYIIGHWIFGRILCNIWISLDVLLCTASILSMCAISLDRYLAVIHPIKYSKRRRSKRLALLMILVVWVVAFMITCPPLFGWYKPDDNVNSDVECEYDQNKGYVVFSAMGSFFIPLSVMLYVYLRIGFVLMSRQQRMVRDAAPETSNVNDNHQTSFFLGHEQCQINQPVLPLLNESKSCTTIKSGSPEQATIYNLAKPPKFSSEKRGVAISFAKCSTQPLPSTRLAKNSPTFPESRLPKNKKDCGRSRNVQNKNISQYPSLRIPMRVSTSRRVTKTTKTLTIVMGGFIACWLPFFCYYLFTPFLPAEAISKTLRIFFTWIGWINCAVNPFIYASYNPDFRSAFLRLTIQNVLKKRSNQTNING